MKKSTFYSSIFCLILLSIFCFLNSTPAQAANLRLSPGSGNFLVGSTFDISIILNTKGAPINFTEVELFFPPDKLQIISPSVGRSVIEFWPTSPVFSNQDGRLYFAGGSPSPGINTSEGVVLTLTFRIVSSGEAEVRFGGKTSVLANDGKGTEVLSQTLSAFFRFSPPPPLGPIISSPTHPDQERWHKDNNPIFIWPKGEGTEAYSFKIDSDPFGFPGTIVDSVESTASFANLENGIWYFHLREKARGVWGGASRYVVKIDNEPPASFRINISPGTRTSNQNPILRFFTTDALSGLDRFEIKIISLSSPEAGQALFFNVDSPYQAFDLKQGRYQIVVRAFDKAGNVRDEITTINITSPFSAFVNPEGIDLIFIFAPWFWVILISCIILLIFLLIVLRLWLKDRHYIKYALRNDIGKFFNIFKKKPKNKK